MQNFFNFPETLHNWICIDPGYKIKIPISRYDGFFDGSCFKFCEFNTDGTSGMDEINTLDDAFLQTNIGKAIKQKYNITNFDLRKATLDILIQCYQDYGAKNTPNIAIVDFMESASVPEFKALKNYFINEGYPTEICDIRKLKMKKDGLWFNNFKIDLIYRRAVTDEILNHKTEIKDFLKAYSSHAVCTVGPIRSQIAHSKLVFTFLSNPESKKYFTDSENIFIENHIPLTYNFKNNPELIKTLSNNKNDYFIKPHNAYACKGVYCGMDTLQENWDKIISNILSENDDTYLMQKKIEIPKQKFIIDVDGKQKQLNVTIQPYVFNNSLEGFYPRVSTENIITTYRKAVLLPIFQIQPKPYL